MAQWEKDQRGLSRASLNGGVKIEYNTDKIAMIFIVNISRTCSLAVPLTNRNRNNQNGRASL